VVVAVVTTVEGVDEQLMPNAKAITSNTEINIRLNDFTGIPPLFLFLGFCTGSARIVGKKQIFRCLTFVHNVDFADYAVSTSFSSLDIQCPGNISIFQYIQKVQLAINKQIKDYPY
jgi:hypothetical protein